MTAPHVKRHTRKFINSNKPLAFKKPPIIGFQDELVEMYVAPEGAVEGVETKKGRRFTRWSFKKGLRANQTAPILQKLRRDVGSSFYLRYSYATQLANIETGLKMVFIQQKKGSPWFQNLKDAEKWLNEQENRRLDIDQIKRPNTKWVFLKFSNIEVKTVFDRQALLGSGLLPDWLRNLARGGHQMVALDTFDDNLCFWCCIAVYRGALPHRSTQAVRGLAKSYFQLKKAPTDVPKTSLDKLKKVEKHLNQVKRFADWLGIRVYEPERQRNGEILWHLRKNSLESLKKIITIGVYEAHTFLLKKLYACGS